MVYIAGDNDLEKYIQPDFTEMIYGIIASGGLNTNVNLVLQTDGWEQGLYSGNYWYDPTVRWFLGSAFLSESIGEKNMGDPNTLINFVNWATAEYPADHYSLILWDHGNGFKSVCHEFNAYGNSIDYLSMDDLSYATNNFNKHLDIIGFDACLMAMTEVAYQFRDVADYYVASEPNEPGTGWEYENIMSNLFGDPTITPQQLVSTVVASYKDEYLNSNSFSEALSVIDLSAINELSNSLNTFAETALNYATESDWEIMRQLRDSALDMDPTNLYLSDDFCDLGQFMDSVAKSNVSNSLFSASSNVYNLLNSSVVTEWHDNTLPGASGLTIYLPKPGTRIDEDYNQDIDFLRDTKWYEFLLSFTQQPPPPLTLKLKDTSDSGVIGDGITNVKQPHFEGYAAPYSKVWLDTNDDDVFEAGPYTANSEGLYGFYYTNELSDGQRKLTVSTEDVWGQISYATLTFIIDSKITTPVINDINQTNATSDSSPTCSGTSEPWSTVSILVNNIQVGVTDTDGDGNWSYILPTYPDGPITVKTQATDIAGNISYFSSSITLIIDKTPPTAPDMLDLHTMSDSGTSSKDNITGDSTPTFSWIASVDIGDGISGIAAYQWRIDNEDWSEWQSELTATTDIMPDGNHTFYVRAKDKAGNVGPEASLEFTIDTYAEPPEILAINPDNGASDSDFLTNNPDITLTGLAESGSTMQIYEYGLPIGDPVTTSDETFSVDLPVLSDGIHSLTVKITDIAGNQAASARSLTIDTTPPRVTEIYPLEINTGAPVTEIIIGFSESLDTATAEDIANYILTGANGDCEFSNDFNPIVINSASYNDLAKTVTLLINDTEELPRDLYRFVIDNTGSVTDLAGNLLDGDNDANSGGDYVYEFWVGGMQVEIPAQGLWFYDEDNSLVKVKITAGRGEALLAGENLQVISSKKGTEISGEGVYLDGINLLNSYLKTKIIVTAKGGDNQAILGDVTGTSLGQINAKNVILCGDVILEGSLDSLILDSIDEGANIITGTGSIKGTTLKINQIQPNVNFDIAGTVKNFQAGSFSNGFLMADSIGQVKIKEGDFDVDVKARTGDIIGINVAGDITGDITAERLVKNIKTMNGNICGVVRAGGDIYTIQAFNFNNAILSAGSNIKKVGVKGNIIDSYILAGYDIGADCAFDSQAGGVGDDSLGSGNVESVFSKGIFARSFIGAGTLPNAPLTSQLPDVGETVTGVIGKIKFGGIDPYASFDYGLFAAGSIEPVRIAKTVTSESIGHFCIVP